MYGNSWSFKVTQNQENKFLAYMKLREETNAYELPILSLLLFKLHVS